MLIYRRQVKSILTFVEIKSYYKSFETGKKANKTTHKDGEETKNI
jgi:hypothetical protein